MRKVVFFWIPTFWLAWLQSPIQAACGGGSVISNTNQALATNLDSTWTNVYGRMWVYGNGQSVNSGAARQAQDGGDGCSNVGSTYEPYWEVSGCFSSGYAVVADLISPIAWENGCPANSDRIVVLLQDTSARYAIISKVGSSGTWDLDQVPTQTAAAPAFTITRTGFSGSNVVFTVNLSNLPSNGYGGYAPGDGAPANPLITGYELYYQNAAGTPSNAYSSAWTLCTNGVISGATTLSQTGVEAPLPSGGNTMYLLLRPTFESGVKALYGVLYTGFPPTPAGVFASADAALKKGKVTMTWRTNVEEGTANFEVMASKDGSTFVPVAGTLTEPKGSHSVYSVTFPNPYPHAKKFYLKVRSTDFDGKQYVSNTVTIKRKTALRSGKEVLLDEMDAP